MPAKAKIILYFLAIIKAIIFPIHARQKEHKDDDYKKAKLQTTLLKLGVFIFYTLKFQNLNFTP